VGVTLMVAQLKPPSRILEAVYETAPNLHKPGLIDRRRMQHFTARCQELEPATEAEKAEAVTNCGHL